MKDSLSGPIPGKDCSSLHGARNEISSMWAVRDYVAHEMIAHLYDWLLEGEAKAHAL
jgi:CHAT domain-containing protein